MRVLREKRNLSLREAAAQLGLTAGYLCDLELGRRQWRPALQAMYRSL